MKKKLAYLLACSPNLAFAAGNVALGINKYNSDKDYDILVYHTGLQENDKRAFEQIPHVRLVPYSLPKGFAEFMLGPNGLPPGRWNNPYSLLAFAHFETFILLEQYRRVIWLDIDMAIQADIRPLNAYEGLAMGWDWNRTDCWKVRNQFTAPIAGYDMSAYAYCSACIVISDTLKNYRSIYDFCWAKAKEYAPYLHAPDQALINLALQEFNITPKPLQWHDWLCFAQYPEAHIAKIAHFGTGTKPWNTSWLLQSFPEWFRTHLRWLELGGSDFDFADLDISNIAPAYHSLLQHKTLTRPSGPGTEARLTTFFRYYRCKILSKITWGQKRRHYKQKRDKLHEQIRILRKQK